MASPDRPKQTLADYVGIAVGPVLIMGLVGSLVFFLLEVLYSDQGAYKDRLQWILFFFVFGAVLVGRVSMTQGIAGRAGLYGLVLAGLTWVGMQIYVEYPKNTAAAHLSPLINLFLVAVVWWSAHRLTWDCTNIDEETEVNGEGLLQATGLEKPAGAPPAGGGEPAAEKDEKSPGFLIGWWERCQRFREGRKKRVLGAWVVYFSLAALPLFGLGEALIPADDAARRQSAFWLMGCYVACGLGLLLTTCFLGLRRYLRQRRVQMPAAMTGVWLASGGVLIVALLVVGALLPRPAAEYSLLSVAGVGSGQRSASDYAGQGGSSGKGEGRRIGDQPKDKGEPSGRDKNGQATGRDKGERSGEKDKGGSGGQKDKDGSGGKDKDQSSSQKDKDGSNRDKGNDAPDPSKSNTNATHQPPPQKDSPPRDKTNPQQQNQGKPEQSSSTPQASSHPGSSWDWASLLAAVATVLKWIVFAVLILVVIFFLLREGLKFLANFTDWAKNLLNALQNFWANLFRGAAKEAGGEAGEGGEAPRRPPPAPFSAFVNPFLDGRAERRPIKELVRYTFDALQAWARERNVERRPDETPLEFAARLGDEFPALEAEARRLALLYARAVYDYTPPAETAREFLRQFWQRLAAAAEQPMSV